MRRASTVLGCAAILASLVVTQVVMAGNQAHARSSSATERFYVNETWHQFTGTKGHAKPGDIDAFQGDVSNLAGKRVGSVNGYTVYLRSPYVGWNITAVLPGGIFTVTGTYPPIGAKTRQLFITGGSGYYAGAGGTVTLTDAGSKGDLATVTLTNH